MLYLLIKYEIQESIHLFDLLSELLNLRELIGLYKVHIFDFLEPQRSILLTLTIFNCACCPEQVQYNCAIFSSIEAQSHVLTIFLRLVMLCFISYASLVVLTYPYSSRTLISICIDCSTSLTNAYVTWFSCFFKNSSLSTTSISKSF